MKIWALFIFVMAARKNAEKKILGPQNKTKRHQSDNEKLGEVTKGKKEFQERRGLHRAPAVP